MTEQSKKESLIPSLLYTRSSEELQKAIAEELQVPDPDPSPDSEDDKEKSKIFWSHPGC